MANSQQLEAFGAHCQAPTCNQADFLPFQCPHCSLRYCSFHRLPFAHACQAYDEALADRRVTLCPLCSEPLPIAELLRERQHLDTRTTTEIDPNLAMERHIESGRCRALRTDGNGLVTDDAGNRAKVKGKTACTYTRCNNQMWIDLSCERCGKAFCPTHREPKQHRCQAAAATPSPKTSPRVPSSSKMAQGLSTNTLSSLASSTSAKKASPLMPSSASMGTSSSGAGPSKSASSQGSAQPKKPGVPASIAASLPSMGIKSSEERSVAKRAAEERESAALALKNRAKKGLLSEDEKVRYATMQAMEAKGAGKKGNSESSGGKDCCVS